jgi:hypothetical protein
MRQWKVIYLSSSETMDIEYLLEEIKWLNVQNVELTFQSLRRHGLWLAVQTNLERELS